ncbi:predicted protein [Histoplasma capsulatum G186AR]|uniref:Uncharacterized protein n=1 Tax=Ajellomyces capsulatus (strain G186AR / H82 / ATCC MYA-2454 / RMSCC 2432) TaxID=447093 RepID=C0NHB1_AJECG|nr:uncharacterized protein HCBG_02733 [Histoplasma capsulatum G186AR]EEH09197.1 predicted protein [Histoplasma capsulatum G186AR]
MPIQAAGALESLLIVTRIRRKMERPRDGVRKPPRKEVYLFLKFQIRDTRAGQEVVKGRTAINQVAGGSSSTLGPISQPPAKPPSQITDMIFQQLHGRLFPSPQPWCPTSTTQQRQQPTANSQQPAANSKQAIPCPDRGAVCLLTAASTEDWV